MEKIKLFKLNKKAKDTATKEEGTIVLCQIDGSRNVSYLLQKPGLNKETGEPLSSIWTPSFRLEGVEEEDHELPLDILGSTVTDLPTGFTGFAESLILHVSGCLHVNVVPEHKKQNGEDAPSQNFALNRLIGLKIPMTEEQREEEKKTKPSPGKIPEKRKPRI